MVGGRRGIVSEYLPWILIAVAVLAIVLVSMLVLREGGSGIIEKIKNLFLGR